jgi:hypothetical protein
VSEADRIYALIGLTAVATVVVFLVMIARFAT